MRFIPFLLSCVIPVAAQTAGVPRLGWVLEAGDQSAVREAIGIPGAAQLGAGRQMPAGVSLFLRPGSGTAIALQESGPPLLGDLDSIAAGLAAPLEGALEEPDMAAWSPLGEAFLLASFRQSRLQVWRADADGWRLTQELPLSAESAAVSDEGEVLARIGGVLYRIGAEGAMLEVSREAGEFTFLAGSRSFAWAEASRVLISGGASMVDIPFPDQGGAAKVLVFSPVRGKLAVVQAGEASARLTLWSEDGSQQGEWLCPAALVGISASGTEGVVRLIAQGDGPVWMASFDDAGGRVFFVPRPVAEEGESR